MVSENYYANLNNSEGSTQSATSSAVGKYQFLKSTWDNLKANHPELGSRTDPASVERAIRIFTEDNAKYLRNKGIPDTDLNVHMAHFLGPSDAKNFINAHGSDPNTPAINVVRKESVAANHSVFYHGDGTPKTVGEIYQNYGKKFDDTSTEGYVPPEHYNPATRGITVGSAPSAPAVGSAPAAPAAGSAPSAPAAAPATTNPMAASRDALTGGASSTSSLQGQSGKNTSLFTPYQYQPDNYYVQPLPMKVGGHARAHKIPILPSHLAKNKHFSTVWEGIHTNPSSVSHEDLIKAHQMLTGADENAAAAPTPEADQAGEGAQPAAFASGGAVQETEAGAKNKTAIGYIKSDTGGTADKLSFNVVQDSYVIPADIVSGLGHGNSDAGAKIIAERFKGRLSARTKGDVPVKLSGGEYVIPPHVVKRVGNGSIERGIDHFEEFIATTRARTIWNLHHKKKPIR